MPPMTRRISTQDGINVYVETTEGLSPSVALEAGASDGIEDSSTQTHIPYTHEAQGTIAAGSVEGVATEIGFSDTFSMLRDAVSAFGGALHGALGRVRPSEMTVSLNFVLKGDVQIIPVLAQGSGEGSIQIVLKWMPTDATGQ